MILSSQISRTGRYMDEYTRNASGENWRRMISEIKALEAMQTTPLLLVQELEAAMKRDKPEGWPAGTKTWSK